MYKATNLLSHFRFNTIHHIGPVGITWFKYIENEEFEVTGFTIQELNELTNYFARTTTNFSQQNYFNCTEEDIPNLYLHPVHGLFPRFLIINGAPNLHLDGNIYSAMEVELLSRNGRRLHHYELNFNIIGRID